MLGAKATVTMDPDALRAKLVKALLSRKMKCGYLVEAEAKRLLSTTDRSKSEVDGKVHYDFTPSDPGMPPHLRTGNMRANVRTLQGEGGGVIVAFNASAWYSIVHEFGGKHHPARPTLRPALANCRAKFPALFLQLDFEK